ncbi:hypothetical protein ACP70R_019877 [Stipagrostis hirtigluma subsp. patula]
MVNLDRVVETAAGGSISNIVRKLASLTLNQVSQLRGVSGNIDWLKEELQILHAVLLDLSNEEDPPQQLKLWKNKVRELAYDIEDAIDKFLLASSVRNADESSHDPSFTAGIMATIQRCTDRIRSLPSDYLVASEIQRLKGRVTRVAAAEERRKRLKARGSNSDGSSRDAIAIRDAAQYADCGSS